MYLARVVSGFGRDRNRYEGMKVAHVVPRSVHDAVSMDVFVDSSRDCCIEVYETVEKLLGTFVSTTTVLRVVDNCEKHATVVIR
jgi:hypothetical protein